MSKYQPMQCGWKWHMPLLSLVCNNLPLPRPSILHITGWEKRKVRYLSLFSFAVTPQIWQWYASGILYHGPNFNTMSLPYPLWPWDDNNIQLLIGSGCLIIPCWFPYPCPHLFRSPFMKLFSVKPFIEWHCSLPGHWQIFYSTSLKI